MSKKKIVVLVAVVAFLIITAVSTIFAVQTAARASDAKTTTIHLAFTGIITYGKAKGTPLIGGLTEVIRSTGYFNGNLHMTDGTQISTSGKVDDKRIEITFYNMLGAPVIRSQGHLTKSGDYVGAFQIYYKDKRIDKGLWSALPVADPKEAIALAFVGLDTKGPHKNTVYTGSIVLNEDTFVGTFNLPNGAVIPVVAKFDSKGNITVTFNFSSTSKIGGIGVPSHQGNLKGYVGTFAGPDAQDAGQWVAYGFRF